MNISTRPPNRTRLCRRPISHTWSACNAVSSGTATTGILFTSLFNAAKWFIDKEVHSEQVYGIEQTWLYAYEQALQGEESSLIDLLERNDRSEEEDTLLVDLSNQENLKRLQDFQASHPTDEDMFDIAV